MVKFEDQSIDKFWANRIPEKIYSQVDQEGRHYNILDNIIGHKKDGNAIEKENGYWISYNGNQIPKKTSGMIDQLIG